MPDEVVNEGSALEDEILVEGIMAAGALIALADQKLDINETLTLECLLAGPDLLQRCNTEHALGLYTFYVKLLREDYAKGKEEALDAISLCREDIEGPALIVRGGIAVAQADNVLSECEVSMIEEICEAVGIEGLDTLGMAGSKPAESN